MKAFRLCKEAHSPALLSGEGGLEADGRWHTRGQRIVYCASCEALAVIEVRVHVGRFIPHARYLMHEIEVPDDTVIELARGDVPEGWDSVPYTAITQDIGDRWHTSETSGALRVPSIHSRTDATILLNPAHRDAVRVSIVKRWPHTFDPRLFGIKN